MKEVTVPPELSVEAKRTNQDALPDAAMVPGAVEGSDGDAPTTGSQINPWLVTGDEILAVEGSLGEQVSFLPKPPAIASPMRGSGRLDGSKAKRDVVRAADDTSTIQPTSTERRRRNKTWAQAKARQSAKNGAHRSMLAALTVVAIQRQETDDTLRQIYTQVDASNNGLLELDEFRKMIKLCSAKVNGTQTKMTRAEIEEIFNSLDLESTGSITFHQFKGWFWTVMRRDVRAARFFARQLFIGADKDNSGTLDRQEVERLARKLVTKFPQIRFRPEIDMHSDFELMASSHLNDSQRSDGCVVPDTVCWNAFEDWWRMRTGDDEGKSPVLPEAMVLRTDALAPGTGRALHLETKSGWKLDGDHDHPANVKQRWDFLLPRLRILVSLSNNVWGSIPGLYGTGTGGVQATELYTMWMLHPNSVHVRFMDSLSTFAIAYTVLIVPLRLGFSFVPDPYSTSFWFDTMVDFVFIVDIIVHFRTAHWTSNGSLEQNPRQIAMVYLKSWFFVDLLSSIPFAAIATMANDSNAVGSVAGLKWIRMARLTKMMRVARIMKMLDRHARLAEFAMHMSALTTFAAIAYGCHVLACFWYFLGSTNELGWVKRHLSESTDACPLCPDGISDANRYAHSLYTIFKMGDVYAVSAAEKTFAAAFAGLMSQLMMSKRIGENEHLTKLAQLKAWMKHRDFSRSRQRRVLKQFSTKNQSSTDFDERTILSYLPVGFSRDLSLDLYKPILSRSPFFRLLSKELMLVLCESITPQPTVSGFTIFKAGDIGREMYFVLKGEVEVTSGPECDHLGYIGADGFFGEMVVIESVRRVSGVGAATRSRTVRATQDSELGILSVESVRRACDRFPELQVRLLCFYKSSCHKSPAAAAQRVKRAKSLRQMSRFDSTDMMKSSQDAARSLDAKTTFVIEQTADEAADALIAASSNDLATATERLLAAHRRAQLQ